MLSSPKIGFCFTLQSIFISLRVLRVYVFRDDVVLSHVSISNAFRKARSLKFRGCQQCVCTKCALPLDAKDLTSALEIVLTLDLATVDPQHLCLCQSMFLFIL